MKKFLLPFTLKSFSFSPKKPFQIAKFLLAEREGFEPSVPFRAHILSRDAHSTALAPLRTTPYNNQNARHLQSHQYCSISLLKIIHLWYDCPMEKGVYCEDCGPDGVSHANEWASAVASFFFWPLFSFGASLAAAFSPLFSFPGSDRFLPEVLTALTKLTDGRILHEPDEKNSWRAKTLWEEASKRGIRMREFRPLALPRDLFTAEFQGQLNFFQDMPRPKGFYSRSMCWMDDKRMMRKVFEDHGIPVANGKVCMTKHSARAACKNLEKPLIVKPSLGSRSRHTTIHITTEEGLLEAFVKAKQISPWVIIEEELTGSVFRVSVIGGKVVAVMERKAPLITGDGIHSIKRLVHEENKNPLRKGPIFHTIPTDKEARDELSRQGFTWNDIPPKGTIVTLNQKISRAFGATTKDVTDDMHEDNKMLCQEAARVLNDPLIGIDMIIPDISKSWKTQNKCGIIECNSVPFLDLHYFPYEGRVVPAAKALWDIIFPVSSKHAG